MLKLKYLVELELNSDIPTMPEFIRQEIYTTLTTSDSEEVGIKNVKVTKLNPNSFFMAETLTK